MLSSSILELGSAPASSSNLTTSGSGTGRNKQRERQRGCSFVTNGQGVCTPIQLSLYRCDGHVAFPEFDGAQVAAAARLHLRRWFRG